MFQRAGYTCVAFDYRGFGQSKGSEPQILNFEMQQQDWAVVRFAGDSRSLYSTG